MYKCTVPVKPTMAGWKCVTKLSNEGLIPQLGLGTYNIKGLELTKKAILVALDSGYRLIDTAQSYENESDIGAALKESGLRRDEYYVVTKLHKEHNGYSSARTRLTESLERLGLDHVDMYLIHNPTMGKLVETWRAFTDLQKEGLARYIGVSNFNIHHFEGLEAAGFDKMPCANQIELHPWLQQKELVSYCKKRQIDLMAYCPLARCLQFGNGKSPQLDEIASRHKKTKSQILVRWSLQSGFICIPKSSKEERIIENSLVYDFELSDNEMKQLNDLDCQLRVSIDAVNSPWIS